MRLDTLFSQKCIFTLKIGFTQQQSTVFRLNQRMFIEPNTKCLLGEQRILKLAFSMGKKQQIITINSLWQKKIIIIHSQWQKTNNHHRFIMPKKSSLFIHNGKKQIIIIDSSWQRSCLPMAISWDKNKNKELNKK